MQETAAHTPVKGLPQHQVLADGEYHPKRPDDYHITQIQLALEDLQALKTSGQAFHFADADKTTLASKLSEHGNAIIETMPNNPLGHYASAMSFLTVRKTQEGHEIPAFTAAAAESLVTAHKQGHLPSLHAMTELLSELARQPKQKSTGAASVEFNPYAGAMQKIQQHMSTLNAGATPTVTSQRTRDL